MPIMQMVSVSRELLLVFTQAQQSLIIIVAIVLAVALAANAALLVLFFRKRRKSKMSTDDLQRQRDELLKQLDKLRAASQVYDDDDFDDEDDDFDEEFFDDGEEAEDESLEDTEEADDDDGAVDDEPDDDVEDDEPDDGEEDDEAGDVDIAAVTVPQVGDETEQSGAETPGAAILAVRDMSVLMRQKFGVVGDEYARKQYYVRYTYGFEAKLRASSDEIKGYYVRIMDTLGRYGKLKVTRSFRNERIYAGRKTFGLVLFRGKTLCVALALNPADYEETKYRGVNVGDKKRFAKTPMLIRITSKRRLQYAQYLIGVLAGENGVELTAEGYKGVYRLGTKSKRALFAANTLKITVLGEAPDLPEGAGRSRLKILAVRDMSPLMRERFGLVGAEFDGKSYYVRQSYSFEAKLRAASDDIKRFYTELMTEIGYYRDVKVMRGFKNDRLYCGRKTAGLVLFKGKTLCVALALDPASYDETKYRGIDVGEIKRFAKTPMLVKITSAQRAERVKELLGEWAKINGIERAESAENKEYSLDALGRDECYAANLLKIAVVSEVPVSNGHNESAGN